MGPVCCVAEFQRINQKSQKNKEEEKKDEHERDRERERERVTVLSSAPITFALFSSEVTRAEKIKQLDKSLFQTKLKRDANNNHDKQAKRRDPGRSGTGPYRRCAGKKRRAFQHGSGEND